MKFDNIIPSNLLQISILTLFCRRQYIIDDLCISCFEGHVDLNIIKFYYALTERPNNESGYNYKILHV